jgi:UDP-N-acetylmuramate--alanine ligase
MIRKIQKVHFVGIGGSGMSGIAEVLINLGHKVSGSDLKMSSAALRLKEMGADIFVGHHQKNIKDAQTVVVSTAISKNNPEVLAAHKNKIPVIRRVEMLAEIARLKYCVTIAGTHGKTTTTSMAALVLAMGGFDPTIVIGGRLKNLNSGARLGQGDYAVMEADESDGSFLKLSPAIAIATNIDNDHLDYYGDMENLKNAFVDHINSIPFYGSAVLCLDDKNIAKIIKRVNKKYLSYGLKGDPDLKAQNIRAEKGCNVFSVTYKGKAQGDIRLRIPGIHNISNSLAAIGAGLLLDMPFKSIADALYSFDGVGRRLEIKWDKNEIIQIDDYGHHPTEVSAVIKAIKHFWKDRRLVVLFQPHRYTRTQNLFKEFGASFKGADRVFVLDIYPAGEKPIKGISSELILKEAAKNRIKALKYPGAKDLINFLEPKDIVLTLGAGDVWKEGEKLLTLI